MVLPLDALFGLPRKKAARKSRRDPLHGEIFFANQSSVDKHVATYKMLNQQTGNASGRILDGHVPLPPWYYCICCILFSISVQ